MLITHVVVGIIGVSASYALLMAILKKKPSLWFMKLSALIAFLSYLVSWGSGGYYYVLRYGAEVKPVIKAGDYPWAHGIFMESKEHIFLFIPVLIFTTLFILWTHGHDVLANKDLKRALAFLVFIIFLLALFVTLSGIIVSDSAG
ncbi:hypothetical protein CL631_01375 [bacterium]|nr:hypothetical protein [bacterium]MDP6659628.1 hypothetical protein [Candidatus Paceibacterota bacterium]